MFTIIDYNETEHKTSTGSYAEIGALLRQPKEGFVQWVDIDIARQNSVEQLAAHYNLHHLTVEDIFHTEHLPKFEAFDDYFFLALKMMRVDADGEVVYEHISLVAGKGYIITFQEKPGDVFEDVRNRIIHYKGNVRRRKSDYLFIRLLDAIVDNYGITLEHTRLHIESLETNLLNGKRLKNDIISEILYVKKDLNLIRSYIVPMREILIRVKTETGHFMHKTSNAYLNDIQDHIAFQISFFETFREMLKDLLDLHNTQTSNELNNIMKTLTIISALFIPLTFVAGWYGMNFEHMPELEYIWSYPILIGLMVLTSLGMFIYMKTKKWF